VWQRNRRTDGRTDRVNCYINIAGQRASVHILTFVPFVCSFLDNILERTQNTRIYHKPSLNKLISGSLCSTETPGSRGRRYIRSDHDMFNALWKSWFTAAELKQLIRETTGTAEICWCDLSLKPISDDSKGWKLGHTKCWPRPISWWRKWHRCSFRPFAAVIEQAATGDNSDQMRCTDASRKLDKEREMTVSRSRTKLSDSFRSVLHVCGREMIDGLALFAVSHYAILTL